MKKINKGDLLVSMPEILDDAIFNRTVIFITQISNDSVTGFILNKCHQFNLTDVDKRISEHKIKIYDGGPLSKEKIYFIHNKPQLIPESVKFYKNMCFGGDFNKVIELINDGLITNNNIRLFSGYTGWDYKQLVDEIENKCWFISDQKNIKLGMNNENLWKNLMMAKGGGFQIWSNAPSDPLLN